MERIKQALEKARSEREKGGSGSGAIPTFASASVPELIAYTHTRTVEVAKDLLREKRIISGIEQNSFTEAYKILRTRVLHSLKENGWNSVAITSPGCQEGKTSIAINLAISLAMEVDYTVLLVDADLRHPSIQNYFGLDTEKGLSEYLTDNEPLDKLLIHPAGFPRFILLPGGKSLINSSEMLNSPKMVRLVEELKTRYPSRIVIFDLPPLLTAADALVFSPYVDTALLVIEEGKTESEDVKRAVGLMQGYQFLGTVLNKSWTGSKDGGDKSVELFERLIDRIQLYYQPMKQWYSRMRKGKS